MTFSRILKICFLVLLNIETLQAKSTYEAKVRLESALLKTYWKEARPVLDVNDNVTITIGISLYNIKNMDDRNQILTLSLWIRQKWNDPRLRWQPSKFSSVKSIHISPEKIWVPDLKIYNEADQRVDSGLDRFRTKLIVANSGDVKWMAPSVIQLSCQVDVRFFPYDTQTCKIKIGSWTYNGYAVDVKPENFTMDITKFHSNLEWKLVSTSVQKNVQVYPCCPEPYPDVTYTIKIERRTESYWINFIFPGILLTLMTMVTFITPASDTGERVSLVLTSLVSMFFFLKMVAGRTPSSETIPLLSSYFVMLIFEIGLVFYAICVSFNAYHKHPALGDMPHYIRNLVLEKLGRLWGLTKESQVINRKLDVLQNLSLMKGKITVQLEEMKTVLYHSKKAASNDDEVRKLGIKRRRTGTDCLRKQDHSRFLITSEKREFRYVPVSRETPLLPDSLASSRTTHQGGNLLSEHNDQRRTMQSRQKLRSHQKCVQFSEIKGSTCSCPTLLQDMVIANERLLSSIQEIVYVAREFNRKSSEKEHWLLAAAILDRAFVVLFVLVFFIISLINFLW